MASTPIVLHHGLLGHGELRLGPFTWEYFHRIGKAITERGNALITTSVHPTAGIETRARQLKESILSQIQNSRGDDARVVIIAHSLGGLDARYMITHLDMSGRVAALVTLCTPHRGTPYADWVVRHIGERLGALRLMEYLNLDVQAVADLTTASCRRFNETTPDAPGVAYLSIAGTCPLRRIPPWAIHSWRIIQRAEGDNDGLVSVKSATWADFLGRWPADHWHSINRRFSAPWTDSKNGDMTPNYLKVLDTLESRGLMSSRRDPTQAANASA